MMIINELLKELSEFRPLFHNELDFQFHFAWLLKEKGYVKVTGNGRGTKYSL